MIQMVFIYQMSKTMQSDSIFLLKNDGQLIEMGESAYDTEDLLQSLIEDHPNLLAGKQMNSESPRRWLLISREISVPSEESGGGRWSLDHLFLDQDGIPTLIEVKRSSDTRIRREVVGQILDYAANAVLYWPIEDIRNWFKSRCERKGLDSDLELREFLSSSMEPDQFWATVKTNLQAEKIRLVFVSDNIPSELQRIVEFLNGQMDPAEVIAIQITQYRGEDLTTLVPRVIGQTAEAKSKKSRGSKRKWDEQSFFAEIIDRRNSEESDIARKIFDWAKESGFPIKWGQGPKFGTFYPLLQTENGYVSLFGVSTEGKIELDFSNKKKIEKESRIDIIRRLNNIPGVNIKEERFDTWGGFPISAIQDERRFQEFIKAIEEFAKILLRINSDF